MEVKRIRPGVKALIVHEGKVLIIKERLRNASSRLRITKGVKIIHDFPGGGMEVGEHLQTALWREVFEEIGLKIKVGKVVGAWDFLVLDHQDEFKSNVQIVCIGYQCTVIGDHEHSTLPHNFPASKIKFDTTKNPAHEDIFDHLWLTPEEILAQGEKLLPIKEMRDAVANLVIK